MDKDQWKDSQSRTDPSKGDVRPSSQDPFAKTEEGSAMGKRNAGTFTDEVRDVARSASGAAKEVGKEAKATANDVAGAAGSVASKVKEGAQDTKDAATNLGDAAKDAVAAAKDTAAEVGTAAKDGLTIVKEDANELLHAATTGAKEITREVGPALRRASRATGAFVAGNAVPLSLLGFGAGWVLMRGSRRSAASQKRTPGIAVESTPVEIGESIGEKTHDAQGKTGELVHAAGERAREVAHETGERAREVVHETRERATQLKDKTAHRLEDAREAVSRQATKLREEARCQYAHAKQATSEFAQHNPLVLMALSLGAGMGSSYLFPSTRSEKRLMGEPRERIVGEARQTLTRIGEIAHKAASDARHLS